MRTFIAAGSVLGLILTVPGLARSEFCPINCPSGMVALGDPGAHQRTFGCFWPARS